MEPFATVDFDRRIQLPVHALFVSQHFFYAFCAEKWILGIFQVGASQSGKTRLALRLLEDPELFNPPPKTIFYHYDQMQPGYIVTKNKLEEKGVKFSLHRGCEIRLDDLPHFDHQAVIIIDDFSTQTASSAEITRLICNSRHKNISVFLIWHFLFNSHSNSRLISQNIGLFFFLPSLRLESQLRTFGAQLGIQQRLLSAYKKCVQNNDEKNGEHKYLLVDLTCNNVPDLLRLRSHIHLPIQYCYG